MRKLLPVLYLYFGALSLMAQNRITISGILQDSETEEPLIFATIGVRNRPIGTISNASGAFDFHIDQRDLEQGDIVISMLGYETLSLKISQLEIDKPVTFHLKKVPKILNEVIIIDSLTSTEILEIAINKIPINYATAPFMLDGFYRDLKRVNGTYISLLESALHIFDNNYEEPRNPRKLREKVELVQVRKSLGYDHELAKHFDQDNLLEEMLIQNIVRYYGFPNLSNNDDKISRLPRTVYNGRDVYVLKYRHSNERLKIFIETGSYAIVRIEQTIGSKDHAISEVLRHKKSLYLDRFVTTNKVIEFKEYDGLYYLNYFTLYKRNQWYNQESRTLDYDMELFQELLINNISPDTQKRIKSSAKMKKYGLQYQDMPYDREFWKDYNMIKQTPLDEKIMEDLERYGKLENQFSEQ
jgi:hypothetical protein